MTEDPRRGVDANDSNIGIAASHDTHVEGGINFYNYPKSSTGIPLQRPKCPEHFKDREKDLKELLEDLKPGKIVTLHGPGGIGKTAISAKAVWTLAPENEPPEMFPDGIIFHSFYEQPNVNQAFDHIVRSYIEHPDDTSWEAAFRLLADKKALLIWDGAEEADDFQKVLDLTGNCGVIVTSRRRKDAVTAPKTIRALPPDESVDLLKSWAKDQDIDDETAKQICKLVGNLPLAVRLTGRYLMENGEPVGEYLKWLEKTTLEALAQGDRKTRSVPLLIERSLAQVNESARQLLAVSGLLSFASFSQEVMEAALPEQDIRTAVNELYNYGLLLRTDGRLQISHALIHTYAREKLPAPESAPDRIAEYYINLARKHCGKYAEGFQSLDPERPHIMAVMAKCGDRNILNLLDSIDRYCTYRGYYMDLRTGMNKGMAAARRLEDKKQEANCIQALGHVHIRLAEYEDARTRFEEAWPIYNQIGDRLGEANCMKALGDVHIMLAEYEDARTRFEEARSIYNQIGDRLGEAHCIKALGHVHIRLAEYEDARTRFEEAWPIYNQIGDRLGEANCMKALGDVHIRLDEYEDARTRFEEARSIYNQIGDRLGEAHCIKALGHVHIRLAEYEDARTRFEETRTIYNQIGARLGEANCIQALGDVHIRLAEYEDARKRFEEARPIYNQIGDRLGEANCIQALGEVHIRLDEYVDARKRFEEARPIYNQIGARLGEANCIQALGEVHIMLDEYEDARTRYEEARPIYNQIGDRLGEANCIQALGEVHRMLDEYEDARTRFEEARPIFNQIGARHDYAATMAYLGLAYNGLKNPEEARKHLSEAITIFESIKSPVAAMVREWLDAIE